MRALAEVGGSGIICRDDWNSPYILCVPSVSLDVCQAHPSHSDYLPLPHIDSPPKKDSP